MNKELWKSYESCLKNDAIGCHEYSLVFKNHRIFTLRKDFFISPNSGFNFLCYFFPSRSRHEVWKSWGFRCFFLIPQREGVFTVARDWQYRGITFSFIPLIPESTIALETSHDAFKMFFFSCLLSLPLPLSLARLWILSKVMRYLQWRRNGACFSQLFLLVCFNLTTTRALEGKKTILFFRTSFLLSTLLFILLQFRLFNDLTYKFIDSTTLLSSLQDVVKKPQRG